VLYVILKFLHVIAVILWIGPPLGAYYFLYRAHRSKQEATILWSEQMSERVLRLEHGALLVLIASGLVIVQQSDWALLAVPWLQKKLALFGGVMIFELYDIWFAHRFMRRLLRENVPLSDPRWLLADRLRRFLIISAIPVGALLVPLILWFAIAKQ
jgi:uncharacterized membrane protein